MMRWKGGLPHPLSRFNLRMVLMTPRCQSCVPWHMFSRATFIPLAANVCSISGELELGPMVQMIFVLLVLLKPAFIKAQ